MKVEDHLRGFPQEALQITAEVDPAVQYSQDLKRFISKKKRPGKLIHSSTNGKTYKKPKLGK